MHCESPEQQLEVDLATEDPVEDGMGDNIPLDSIKTPRQRLEAAQSLDAHISSTVLDDTAIIEELESPDRGVRVAEMESSLQGAMDEMDAAILKSRQWHEERKRRDHMVLAKDAQEADEEEDPAEVVEWAENRPETDEDGQVVPGGDTAPLSSALQLNLRTLSGGEGGQEDYDDDLDIGHLGAEAALREYPPLPPLTARSGSSEEELKRQSEASASRLQALVHSSGVSRGSDGAVGENWEASNPRSVVASDIDLLILETQQSARERLGRQTEGCSGEGELTDLQKLQAELEKEMAQLGQQEHQVSLNQFQADVDSLLQQESA